MMSECEGNAIRPRQRIFVPHSLASLYTMICSFIGYDRYGDEGKVMALAPLGRDRYRDVLSEMIRCIPEGFRLAIWTATTGSSCRFRKFLPDRFRKFLPV